MKDHVSTIVTMISRKTLGYRGGIIACVYLLLGYVVFVGRERMIILGGYEWLMMLIAGRASYFFVVPLINTSISEYRKSYYLTLPSYLKALAVILMIVIFIRFPTRESALVINTLILWGFIFFDSRYFALGAAVMVWMIIGHLLFGDQVSADYSAIMLYYYLVLAVVFGFADDYVDRLIKHHSQ
ncbi:hypothetical protein XF24_00896 [candidate division SR1 bacterium Aalborg_AAW-1]|nr:hypothetical protein XF24_00896 [candidate division SR1 bacterium Aalborg_AAW-1]